MGAEITKTVSAPLQLCTHDFSRYCLDECTSECKCGCASCRVQTHHTAEEDDEESVGT